MDFYSINRRRFRLKFSVSCFKAIYSTESISRSTFCSHLKGGKVAFEISFQREAERDSSTLNPESSGEPQCLNDLAVLFGQTRARMLTPERDREFGQMDLQSIDCTAISLAPTQSMYDVKPFILTQAQDLPTRPHQPALWRIPLSFPSCTPRGRPTGILPIGRQRFGGPPTVGLPCRPPMWATHVGYPCGLTMWANHVGYLCGLPM